MVRVACRYRWPHPTFLRELVTSPHNWFPCCVLRVSALKCTVCGHRSCPAPPSPMGRYRDASASPITCARCPAGTYSALVGATDLASCQPCAVGLRSPAGASACSATCPVGTNATTSTANQCFPCQGGVLTCAASRGERRLAGTSRRAQGDALTVDCRAGFYKVLASSGESLCVPW